MSDRHELERWKARVQDYLDGTLSRTQALQFYLMVRREPELRAELEAHRSLQSALESLPLPEPSEGFEARILDSVPYERYRAAPPRPRVAPAPRVGLLARVRHRLGAWTDGLRRRAQRRASP